MAKPKLNQIIAVSSSVKSRSIEETSKLYQALDKGDLFDGLSRDYRPDDDTDPGLPAEGKKLHNKVSAVIDRIADIQANMIDVVMTQDAGNQTAVADVVVDGTIVIPQVPAVSLIFLEKRLMDLATMVKKIPVHSPDHNWTDQGDGTYKSDPIETVSKKKILRNHVVSNATDKHPAQVQTYHEDRRVGIWHEVKLTSRLPVSKKQNMLDRVIKLQDAVKKARETANGIEVDPQRAGKSIMDFIIGSPMTK